MKRLVALLLVFTTALAAQAAELGTKAKAVIGAWQLDFTAPDGAHRTPLVIVGRQHDELVAWYAEGSDIQPFKEAKLVDESLQMSIVPKDHNGEITVQLKAQLAGENQCQGTAEYKSKSGDQGQWSFTGKRLQLSQFNEVSHWDLSFTTPDQEAHQAVVTVIETDDKTYGWYTAKDYDLPTKELSINGDRVKMVMEVTLPTGSKAQVTFEGTVGDDDVVKGNANYDLDGSTGSFPFTGKRKA